MTRINLVHVQDLADQHLFAEWREIKMVPAALRRSLKTRESRHMFSEIGSTYTLNAGHVKFFYDKMYFLRLRYKLLTKELQNRGYNIAIHDPEDIFFKDIDKQTQYWMVNWQPSEHEILINIERITLRLFERPDWYRYYGEVKSPQFFIDRYNQQLVVDRLNTPVVQYSI